MSTSDQRPHFQDSLSISKRLMQAFATWLMIASIIAFSLPLWIGLMLLGVVMCFYGGLRRSRWFFLPSFAALLITAGILVSVYHRE
jgi:hypothetical protein